MSKRNIIKKITAVVLALIIISGASVFPGFDLFNFNPITANAEDGTYGNLKYSTNISFYRSGLTITGYVNEPTGKLKIPATINGQTVANIYIGAFENCAKITEIEFEKRAANQPLYIDASAFRGCSSLKKINFENSNTVGLNTAVFSKCTSLESITFPPSLTDGGAAVFSDCTKLKKVNFNNKLKEILASLSGSGYFENCTSLTSITIPASLQTIGNYTFKGSGLTSISIPKNSKLKFIGLHAFIGTDISSINIPASVSEIEAGAFSDCTKLTSVNFEKRSANQHLVLGNGVFMKCSSLKKINIENSNATEIASAVFSNCSSLESITFPDKLTKIGGAVFYNCTKLKSVDLGNSIQGLYHSMDSKGFFQNCSSLKSIMIPASVKNIEYAAFCGCTNLKWVYIEAQKGEQNLNIEHMISEQCNSLTDIYYSGSKAQWGQIKATDNGNEIWFSAKIHFNAKPPEGFSSSSASKDNAEKGDSGKTTDKNNSAEQEKIKDNQFGIEILYPKNCFGKNTTEVKIDIAKLKDTASVSGGARLVKVDGNKLIQSGLYSIKLYDDKDKELSVKNGEVTVKIPLPDKFSKIKDFTIVHWYGNEGRYEKFSIAEKEATIKDGYIIFKTTHIN